MREKERGGQAFFVHNRVETIDETAERLRGLCPGVRFEVAHGQMDEKLLERRMLSFLRGEADVLVATSIIESGIDIPQANTLIVERAEIFGLAQLYQIRGRVGRSQRARLRLPAVPQRRRADRGGDQAPERAQRLHRARRRLQDRDARPRDPRRGQPAGRRAVRPRRGARLRALPGDARRGRPRDGRHAGRRRARARAPGRQRRRLRAGRLRALRAGQGRRPPPRGRRARRRRPRACCATSSRIASARCPSRWRTSSRCSRRGSSSAAPARAWSPSAARCSPPRRSSSRSDQAQELRERVPEARYEPGRSQVSFRVPRDAEGALSHRGRAPRTRCWRSRRRWRT